MAKKETQQEIEKLSKGIAENQSRLKRLSQKLEDFQAESDTALRTLNQSVLPPKSSKTQPPRPRD